MIINRTQVTCLAVVAVMSIYCALHVSAAKIDVPGTVITYSPASSGCYIGSPTIAVLPDGGYVAAHDYFGPESNYRNLATTRVFASSDRGASWFHQCDIKGQLWSTLFVDGNTLYIIGTWARYNNLVIRRSTDGGKTWSEPADSKTGLLQEGPFHCAPVPVVVHDGKVWRAMEYVNQGKGWGASYQAFMMSAPLGSDMLNVADWCFSNRLPCDRKWLDGKFGGWLEGNAIVGPDGVMCNVLRVEYPSGGGKAAIVNVSPDGRTASFDPENGFVDLPGGCSKFTIRYDPVSRAYWALSNVIPERHLGGHPAKTRNTLALIRSDDLKQWKVCHYIAYHPDVRKHGFQYPDWQFEGKDIIAVSRTAFDDDKGGAHNYHDANYMTFHRLKDFRGLHNKELPPLPPREKTKHACCAFSVEGYDFEIAEFVDGATAFGNRNYVWRDIPEKFNGWSFTKTDGGYAPNIRVKAKMDTAVYVVTLKKMLGIKMDDWTLLPDLSFWYSTGHHTRMSVFKRNISAGETLIIPQGNWSNGILLIPAK